jgi:single-strand DNA-binding protein
MANFNKVLLLGNITRDPQMSFTPSQTAVVDFGLAINRKWTGADGQKKEETCFVDCTAFAKTGEAINKYCKKGSPLFVEGRLDFSSWQDKASGAKRSKLKVIVDNFQFIGSANTEGTTVNETPKQDDEFPG